MKFSMLNLILSVLFVSPTFVFAQRLPPGSNSNASESTSSSSIKSSRSDQRSSRIITGDGNATGPVEDKFYEAVGAPDATDSVAPPKSKVSRDTSKQVSKSKSKNTVQKSTKKTLQSKSSSASADKTKVKKKSKGSKKISKTAKKKQ